MLYDDDDCLIDYAAWSKAQVNRVDEGIAVLFENPG